MYRFSAIGESKHKKTQKMVIARIIDQIIKNNDYTLADFKKIYSPTDGFTYKGIEVDYSKFPKGEVNLLQRVEAALGLEYNTVSISFYPITTPEDDWNAFTKEYKKRKEEQEQEKEFTSVDKE